MAWLSGWSYRKEITITGQSGAGTNYQVDFSIGDSAGGDFHLEGHCTNFPQDIEVTDNDETTLLKFWIEDITADPLEMTVKVADDLGSNQTIYIYYGKSGATTNSNGADTFPDFFDDFSGDLSAFGTSGSPSIISGVLTLTDDDKVVSISKFGYGYAFESYAIADEQDSGFLAVRETTANENNVLYIINSDSDSNDDFDEMKLYTTEAGVSTTTLQDNWNDFRTQYRRYSIYRPAADDVTFVQDAHSYNQTTGNIPTVDLGIGFYVWDSSQQSTLEVDWCFVRKCISTEPAFSSAGSEETPPTGAAPTAVFYGPLVGPLGGPL